MGKWFCPPDSAQRVQKAELAVILTADFGRARLARAVLLIEALLVRGMKFDAAIAWLYRSEDKDNEAVVDEIELIRLMFGYRVREADGVSVLHQRYRATDWAKSACMAPDIGPAIELQANSIMAELKPD